MTYIRRVIPQYPRTIHRTTPRMSPDLKPRPGTLAAAKELSFQAKTPASPWLMSFVFIAFAIAICWKKLKPGSHNSIKIGKHIPHGEQSPKMSVPKGLSCPSTVAGLVVHSLRSNISSGLRTAIILQYTSIHCLVTQSNANRLLVAAPNAFCHPKMAPPAMKKSSQVHLASLLHLAPERTAAVGNSRPTQLRHCNPWAEQHWTLDQTPPGLAHL